MRAWASEKKAWNLWSNEKKDLQKRSSTSQLQRGHAANEAFGTQEEDFQFCERVFLHRYSLSFRDLHGDMQVLWLKMSKSEISFGKGAPISTSMFVFSGSKGILVSIKVYRECNEPFYRFYFSTRISWNVTIVVDDRIWGFVTALHWCNWFLDAWRVWTPQLCIAWKSGQTWMCTTVYVTLLADIYADLQHEWGSKKKHTVPSMILWC